ncbi:auxin-induced protein 15A [Henckelia pumila]|uniref:auxin-induced protein 15A n=1 Tax=Henckelia pumila TaxID=405737 RepID=UPI003C6DC2D7
MERLQKTLVILSKNVASYDDVDEFQEVDNVPDDVKKGHFAVIAADCDEWKRFVVPLCYLAHPSFLRLLEQAAEEYGFDRDGALTVPCRPSEIEQILTEGGGSRVAAGSGKWGFML